MGQGHKKIKADKEVLTWESAPCTYLYNFPSLLMGPLWLDSLSQGNFVMDLLLFTFNMCQLYFKQSDP